MPGKLDSLSVKLIFSSHLKRKMRCGRLGMRIRSLIMQDSELEWSGYDDIESTDWHSEGERPPHFHPEFGRFMLEATPGRPWGFDCKDLLNVEEDMKWR